MGGRLRFFFLACAIMVMAPSAESRPVPDPTVPPPQSLHATDNQTTGMMNLTWAAPNGWEDEALTYRIYQDGDFVATVEDTRTLLPIPDVPALLQVTTFHEGDESAQSASMLYLGSAPMSTHWMFLLERNLTNCGPLIVGGKEEFPFVGVVIDWDCLPVGM